MGFDIVAECFRAVRVKPCSLRSERDFIFPAIERDIIIGLILNKLRVLFIRPERAGTEPLSVVSVWAVKV